MANNLLTNGIVVKEALPILRNKLPMVAKANREFQDAIADESAMSGDSINIKRPPRYQGRTGELMKVESTVETSIPLTLTFFGVDVSFSQKDLQMSMDDVKRGGLNHVLEPAMARIAGLIEVAGTSLFKGISNVVGTPGTPPTTTAPIALANAILTANGAPNGNRMALIEPFANASLAQGTQTIFNPSKMISEQYLEGRMGTAYGFDFYEDTAIQSFTAGPQGGTPVVNGAGQTGSSLVTNGWTAAAALRLRQGDTFTLAGVFLVNPQTLQQTSQLQSFVVTADVSSDGAGNATIPIFPAITPSGQFQNVSASPAAGAALTVTSGTSNQVSRQSILAHQNAFTFASVPLALPTGVAYAGRATDKLSGLSIRCVSDYNITNNQVLTRFDVFAGWALTYPELGVRLEG